MTPFDKSPHIDSNVQVGGGKVQRDGIYAMYKICYANCYLPEFLSACASLA